mmetsp:Transcript_24654/g.53307  ORF Transcript_24654/g.53307 Transcript_24654/m.53307 type:complete len:202 (+) Transcript_24654:841-1446(+)
MCPGWAGRAGRATQTLRLHTWLRRWRLRRWRHAAWQRSQHPHHQKHQSQKQLSQKQMSQKQMKMAGARKPRRTHRRGRRLRSGPGCMILLILLMLLMLTMPTRPPPVPPYHCPVQASESRSGPAAPAERRPAPSAPGGRTPAPARSFPGTGARSASRSSPPELCSQGPRCASAEPPPPPAARQRADSCLPACRRTPLRHWL